MLIFFSSSRRSYLWTKGARAARKKRAIVHFLLYPNRVDRFDFSHNVWLRDAWKRCSKKTWGEYSPSGTWLMKANTLHASSMFFSIKKLETNFSSARLCFRIGLAWQEIYCIIKYQFNKRKGIEHHMVENQKKYCFTTKQPIYISGSYTGFPRQSTITVATLLICLNYMYEFRRLPIRWQICL